MTLIWFGKTKKFIDTKLSSSSLTYLSALILLLFLIFISSAQADGIVSVDPASAAQGESNLSVTIALEDSATLPPSEVTPINVSIGSLSGSKITRDNLNITAIFDFSLAESIGKQDVTVTFPSPNGDIILSLQDGFTIEAAGENTSNEDDLTDNSETDPNPKPDIKANGEDGPITISTQDTLSLSVSLNSGDYKNSNADWWILYNIDLDLFYLDLATIGWVSGVDYSAQGGLIDIASFELISQSELLEGTYNFYFGIDMPMDGTLLGTEELFYDLVTVNVVSETYDDTDNVEDSNCDISEPDVHMVITDTLQIKCYDTKGDEIDCPVSGQEFYGQDANYMRVEPDYSLACNNTIALDNNTGLMWEKAHHSERVNYKTAEAYCKDLDIGGFTDWRLPSIKELLSISEWHGSQNQDGAFYLNSNIFDFDYPKIDGSDLTGTHSNQMMGQTWSATHRPDKSDTVYFFNFLDAHIKSQSTINEDSTLFYRCVRGDSEKYENDLVDNGNETVTDQATGLMWQKANGQQSEGDYQFTWQEGMDYCEDLLLAGYDDWRLPDVKELQSIVDYDAADWDKTQMVLDTSVFEFNSPEGKDLKTPPTTSPPNGSAVAPFFWSSTTHGDATSFASYVCFGHCWAVEEQGMSYDVHGPGAQRSDPKDEQRGELWDKIGASIGDQKDVVQVNNFVRCVRN